MLLFLASSGLIFASQKLRGNMSIRSGKGDEGFTDLPFQRMINKDSAEIRALGDLDELLSYLGMVKCKIKSRKDKDLLENIQRDISVIASEISVPPDKKKKLGMLLGKEHADWVKKTAYKLEQKVKINNRFQLPGDGELSASLDISRAVARRAERSTVNLLRKDRMANKNILLYLNCVSDILFILARSKAKCGNEKKKAKRKKNPSKKKGK